MAGCRNTFKDKGGSEKQRIVILTTQANDSMREDTGELSLLPMESGEFPLIHDRMPVILDPAERSEWLSGGVDFDRLFHREHMQLDKIAV